MDAVVAASRVVVRGYGGGDAMTVGGTAAPGGGEGALKWGRAIIGERVIAGWQGKSYVVAGFFGADIKDLAEHRALAAAAKVLGARLAANLPEAENVGGDASASSVPSSVFPGFGLVVAVT